MEKKNIKNSKKINQHELFMLEAIKEAYKGIKQNHGGPFGSVIVKNGKIIARGHNMVIENNDCTAHGEMVAIRAACKKLKSFSLDGCVLYTTGFPCPMCMGACQWARIKEIYYACNVDDAQKIGFDDLKFYKNKLKCTCVHRQHSLKLFDDYLKMPAKTKY